MDKRELIDALSDGFVHRMRDPLWKDILLDDGLKAVFLCKEVQKLGRIKQNGPSYLIYPGAVHTRLSHSLGVYHTGRLIMLSLLSSLNEVPFTVKGIRSFLVACLLHDIGHFPYAHSLKELSIVSHEELARRIIMRDEELRGAIESANADPLFTAAIIDEGALCPDSECMIYRGILSGTLDPDKLDYLNRDAFFAGIPYGLQDNSYIIASLSLYKGALVITKSATSSVEHLLFSKYLMYKTLYWHHGVRSATAMIKKALLSSIRDKVIKEEDLYYIDDEEFALIPKRYNYEPFALINSVHSGALLKQVAKKEFKADGLLEREAKDIYSRFLLEEKIYKELK